LKKEERKIHQKYIGFQKKVTLQNIVKLKKENVLFGELFMILEILLITMMFL
jgi:hypothetical protein